jgi:flagellar motor switch protein FliG
MGNRFDGVGSAAEMLNLLDPETRDRILGELQARDPEAARKIRDRMFTFEELLKIPTLELQKALKLVPSRKLALALRGLSEEILKPIFSALSQRAGAALREDIDTLGPQKLSAVQDARRDLVTLVVKLAASGQLSLR